VHPSSVCLIPARAGSKRIPHKNIIDFHGKPLIAWSIENALASNLFSNVYVSTDSTEIADIATTYGAIVPFLRPAKLADDYASDIDVRNHFLSFLSSTSICARYLCYLYPTAPFATPSILQHCFNQLINSDSSCVFTINQFSYPIQRALVFNEENHVEFFTPQFSSHRSQDLISTYHDAGQCYFFNLSHSNLDATRSGYILPPHSSVDIDTQDDLEFARLLFKLKFL
tara:strand:+ start:14650 stop:15330 length:681 start_codon:yes stop_codon:yes gene_type:complete